MPCVDYGFQEKKNTDHIFNFTFKLYFASFCARHIVSINFHKENMLKRMLRKKHM